MSKRILILIGLSQLLSMAIFAIAANDTAGENENHSETAFKYKFQKRLVADCCRQRKLPSRRQARCKTPLAYLQPIGKSCNLWYVATNCEIHFMQVRTS